MEDNARLLELKRAKETQLRKEDLDYQARAAFSRS